MYVLNSMPLLHTPSSDSIKTFSFICLTNYAHDVEFFFFFFLKKIYKMLLWIMDIWTVISNAKISTVYSSIKMGWRFWCCNGNRCFNGHECVFWKTCLAIKKEGGWGENKNFACGPSLVLHLSQLANLE